MISDWLIAHITMWNPLTTLYMGFPEGEALTGQGEGSVCPYSQGRRLKCREVQEPENGPAIGLTPSPRPWHLSQASQTQTSSVRLAIHTSKATRWHGPGASVHLKWQRCFENVINLFFRALKLSAKSRVPIYTLMPPQLPPQWTCHITVPRRVELVNLP